MTEKVNVISDTIQEFLGVRYYKCGRYFQNKGVRLHRKVWDFHRGEIPKGYDVHHHTGNRARNQIEDLELKEARKHRSDHGKERSDSLKENMKRVQKESAKWHGSEEGRKWHSFHYEETLRKVNNQKVVKICEACLKEYETTYNKALSSKYCGLNCRQAAVRQRAGKTVAAKGRRNYPGLYPPDEFDIL